MGISDASVMAGANAGNVGAGIRRSTDGLAADNRNNFFLRLPGRSPPIINMFLSAVARPHRKVHQLVRLRLLQRHRPVGLGLRKAARRKAVYK